MKSHEFYINCSNREYVPHGSTNLILALHTSSYLKIGLILVVQTQSKISLNMVIIWLYPKNQLQSWIHWRNWIEENVWCFQRSFETQVLRLDYLGKANISTQTPCLLSSCSLMNVVSVVSVPQERNIPSLYLVMLIVICGFGRYFLLNVYIYIYLSQISNFILKKCMSKRWGINCPVLVCVPVSISLPIGFTGSHNDKLTLLNSFDMNYIDICYTSKLYHLQFSLLGELVFLSKTAF